MNDQPMQQQPVQPQPVIINQPAQDSSKGRGLLGIIIIFLLILFFLFAVGVVLLFWFFPRVLNVELPWMRSADTVHVIQTETRTGTVQQAPASGGTRPAGSGASAGGTTGGANAGTVDWDEFGDVNYNTGSGDVQWDGFGDVDYNNGTWDSPNGDLEW
jgi:hypothetical protein